MDTWDLVQDLQIDRKEVEMAAREVGAKVAVFPETYFRMMGIGKDEAREHRLVKLALPLVTARLVGEGSSIGVAKVRGYSEMQEAVEAAAALDADVLCEQFVAGDEVTCPVLGTGDEARALPVIRIVAPEGNYDYQNKYFTDDTKYLVPCGLPEGEEAAIQELVLKAYRVLGCRGWGRIDVMIDGATRKPSLLEINTSPGMTGHSLVPMSARAAGISYEDLCLQLLASAALDHQKIERRRGQAGGEGAAA